MQNTPCTIYLYCRGVHHLQFVSDLALDNVYKKALNRNTYLVGDASNKILLAHFQLLHSLKLFPYSHIILILL